MYPFIRYLKCFNYFYFDFNKKETEVVTCLTEICYWSEGTF